MASFQQTVDSTQTLIEEQNIDNHDKLEKIVDQGDDEEDDDDSVNEDEEAFIQLGFVEEEHCNLLFHETKDYNKWDGGKVGGKPSWLDPVHLPSNDQLLCQSCKDPLSFLLEIYSPLDNNDHAFHRALYVFCCKKSDCIEKPGAVKCFRTQLSQVNDFYPSDPKASGDKANLVSISTPNLCAICGCLALQTCSQCKRTHYCSRLHQKLHWKEHKHTCKSTENIVQDQNIAKEYCFKEYDIVIDAEPEEEEIASNTNASGSASEEDTLKLQAASVLGKGDSNSGASKVWDDAVMKDDRQTKGDEVEKDDANLTQKDYNAALSSQKYDPVYVSFLTRIDRGGKDQVLRYCENTLHRIDQSSRIDDAKTLRNKGRLYMSKENIDKAASMENDEKLCICQHCGAPRVFEFQIMPQLLYFLEVEKDTVITDVEDTTDSNDQGDNKEGEEAKQLKKTWLNATHKDLNWGTIDVFTCMNSCDISNVSDSTDPKKRVSRYVEEFVVLQNIPDT